MIALPDHQSNPFSALIIHQSSSIRCGSAGFGVYSSRSVYLKSGDSTPTWWDFRHYAPQTIEYFVDGLIMENARCYLAAEPKHGKSIFVMLLPLCAASGKPFFDREVKQCPVMMIDKENSFALNWWRSTASGVSRAAGELVAVQNNFVITSL